MIALLLAIRVLTTQQTWEREILCWPDSGLCGPRVVNLGAWDPRPSDWPGNAVQNAPKAWTADETGPAPTQPRIYENPY